MDHSIKMVLASLTAAVICIPVKILGLEIFTSIFGSFAIYYLIDIVERVPDAKSWVELDVDNGSKARVYLVHRFGQKVDVYTGEGTDWVRDDGKRASMRISSICQQLWNDEIRWQEKVRKVSSPDNRPYTDKRWPLRVIEKGDD